MHKLIIFISILFLGPKAFAQYDYVPVFPDLQDDLLFDALQENFTPEITLSFSKTRDTLFSKVWGEQDSLECIYSGFKRYMDPALDPTTTVFNNGTSDGINTEHCYPKSKGASSGDAEANMHNLYPSRVDINSARASNPFSEINDSETTTWYYNDSKSNSIPSTNIDLYSETVSGLFEPRESVKGNIARSMFYFNTIYRNEADAADPGFFGLQLETLCAWHDLDPVDQKEWENSYKIAIYQSDMANPFVMDCSVAARLYCDQLSAACASVSTEETPLNNAITISPNPVSSELSIHSQEIGTLENVSLIDLSGKAVINVNNPSQKIDVSEVMPGLYILRVKLKNRIINKTVVKL